MRRREIRDPVELRCFDVAYVVRQVFRLGSTLSGIAKASKISDLRDMQTPVRAQVWAQAD